MLGYVAIPEPAFDHHEVEAFQNMCLILNPLLQAGSTQIQAVYATNIQRTIACAQKPFYLHVRFDIIPFKKYLVETLCLSATVFQGTVDEVNERRRLRRAAKEHMYMGCVSLRVYVRVKLYIYSVLSIHVLCHG